MEDVLVNLYVLFLVCGVVYLFWRLLTKRKQSNFKLDSTQIIQAQRKAQKEKKGKHE